MHYLGGIKPMKWRPLSWLSNSLVIATAATMILFPGSARSQISIEPMVIETTATQGQAQGTIEIRNPSDEIFRARIYALPFTYNQNGIELLESTPTDLSPYLVYSPREVVVEPGQTRNVRVVARLLPSMGEGEYRAILYTEKLLEVTDGSDTAVNIIPRVGVTMYVRQGAVEADLAVTEATVDDEAAAINLRVTNTGDATARPQPQWTLMQRDEVVAEGLSPKHTVIAQGERNITIDYQSAGLTELSPGTYTLSGDLLWDGEQTDHSVPFSVDFTVPSP